MIIVETIQTLPMGVIFITAFAFFGLTYRKSAGRN